MSNLLMWILIILGILVIGYLLFRLLVILIYVVAFRIKELEEEQNNVQ